LVDGLPLICEYLRQLQMLGNSIYNSYAPFEPAKQRH